MNEAFRKFSHKCSGVAGSPYAFGISVLIIIGWACMGPMFHYTDTWQLIINTSTTIVTFLMVFLIQNTQNRDSRSLHLKIDELIRSNKHARNMMINLDDVSDEELERIHAELCQMIEASKEQLQTVSHRKQHRKKRS